MVEFKSRSDMNDSELKEELKYWESAVENAGGWSSAYFAAKQIKSLVTLGNERGLGFINKFPIRYPK